MTAEGFIRLARRTWRQRWQSWLALALLGALLTVAGLILGTCEGLPGRYAREIPAHSAEGTLRDIPAALGPMVKGTLNLPDFPSWFT
jgi:hypothetical protein